MTEARDKSQEAIVKEAVRQYADARLRGERPEIDELVAKHPNLDRQIREGISHLQRINALFDTLVQPDESDFEDPAAEQNPIGQKVGSYEIIEVIGRGGMGIVYLARDTRLKRSVAVKSIPTKFIDDATARMRFKREAEVLASLNHPSIAIIHDIIEQDKDTNYLVLEYVPGETLAERIARDALTLEEARSVGRQIAEAVAAAHRQGVIHRDLKPGNIKITPEGRVKVLDFGLAKSFTGEEKHPDITATEPGHVIGTPAYMSPEQARAQATDQRTDIWSFGCILFQMLSGKLPFEGQTATDTLVHIIEYPPDWDLLPEGIPENIRAVLRHCLEKDPERRLADIAEAVVEIGETSSVPVTTPLVSKATKPRRVAMLIAAVIIAVLCAVAIRFTLTQQSLLLVVLPFENQGPAEDEFFANGIRDAIAASLASIHDLDVIARESAMHYKDSKKSTAQIAQELKANYVLRTTIGPEHPSDPNGRVIMIPCLVRADGANRWSHTYGTDMAGISQMQSDIAEQVTQAVDIMLLEPERRALASLPTEDSDAYLLYLQGNDYYGGGRDNKDHTETAIGMYREAVKLDPNFTLAYTRLSRAYLRKFRNDSSDEHLVRAWDNANKAFQLSPELPETHKALGSCYYHGHQNYDRALQHFTIARKGLPNDGPLLAAIAYIQRRRGTFEEAAATLEEAYRLSPRDRGILRNLGETFLCMRDYPKAEFYRNRWIKLFPDNADAYIHKAWYYLIAEGNTDKARAVLQNAEENFESTGPFARTLATIELCEGQYPEALALSPEPEGTDKSYWSASKARRIAKIYAYMERDAQVKKYYNKARTILESLITEDPNRIKYYSSVGKVYAGLGQKEDAIREGLLAVEMLPVEKDAMVGVRYVEALACIYAMVGELDKAIDQIEYLLSIPGQLSKPFLKIDPDWKPLWELPRFKQLVGDEP
jgi:serine/threonine protein kinase/tetratricopeptide (TPR) repeat protein